MTELGPGTTLPVLDTYGGDLYAAVGGFDKILALTRRWHDLCLQNPDAAHPFERELHPQHDERLAAYLAEAFGGPALYSAGYGDETHVQRLHACNGAHVELDTACLREFDRALAANIWASAII